MNDNEMSKLRAELMQTRETVPHILEAEIKTEIAQALGEASMCWIPRPSGEFDSTSASRIVDELMAKVKRFAECYRAEFPGDSHPQEAITPVRRKAAGLRRAQEIGHAEGVKAERARIRQLAIAEAARQQYATDREALTRFADLIGDDT